MKNDKKWFFLHYEKNDTLKIILFGLSSCEVTRAKQNEIYLHHKQEKKLIANKLKHEKQEINKLHRTWMNLRSFKTVETQKNESISYLMLCFWNFIKIVRSWYLINVCKC